MNVQQLLAGLKDNSIKFISNGHEWRACASKKVVKEVIAKLEYNINFNKQQLEIHGILDDRGMYYFYWRRLTRDIPLNTNLWDLAEGSCYKCSQSLYLMLTSETEVQFVHTVFRGVADTPIQDTAPCRFAKGILPIVTHIKVDGTLFFVNHFGKQQEAPDNMKYTDAYSINYHIGVVNTAEYLANAKNIGYGQVGNTSIEVFQHRTDRKIWITERVRSIIEDIEYDINEGCDVSMNDMHMYRTLKAKLNDYTYMGSICLDVWRWMCADETTVNAHNLSLNNEGTLAERACTPEEPRYFDLIKCNVASGVWKITHYYQTDKHLFDNVTVAELELV